jgi:hypothetical protein
MPLNEQEIRVLVNKLREKYREYAKKYSPRWFDVNSFEERLSFAIQKRMNLEGFILAEITNFEKIKEKYERKKSAKTFSEKVDQIIEEQLSRIKKYSEITFHPRAIIEIAHFYGAGNDFALHDYPIVTYLIKEEPFKSQSYELENKLEYLFIPAGKRHAKRIEDHVLILNRKDVNDIEIEKDKNEYLKEGAFVLHAVSEYIDTLVQMRKSEWEMPIAFDKLFLEKERKRTIISRYFGHTPYGAFLKVKDMAENIIADFRLNAFKQR